MGGASATAVLVTGASGYIGRFLCDHLAAVEAGGGLVLHAVVGSDAHFSSEFGPQCASVSSVDLRDPSAVHELVHRTRPDVVVHLAAVSAPAQCEQDPQLANAINAPTALLDALDAHAPAARVIFFSTDQVYEGKATSDRWYKADDEPYPVNEYGRSKLVFERELLRRLPDRAIALRCSLVLGPAARGSCKKNSFLQFVRAKLDAREHFDAFDNEFRCAVGVRDVVANVEALVTRGWPSDRSGVFNLGGPDRLSRVDIARAAARRVAPEHAQLVGATARDPSKFAVASPPDISMDSTPLRQLTGVLPHALDDVVTDAFSSI